MLNIITYSTLSYRNICIVLNDDLLVENEYQQQLLCFGKDLYTVNAIHNFFLKKKKINGCRERH